MFVFYVSNEDFGVMMYKSDQKQSLSKRPEPQIIRDSPTSVKTRPSLKFPNSYPPTRIPASLVLTL